MDAVTGAVVIAGLKYVGAPNAALVREFLGKVFAPTGDALGHLIAQPIVEWQKRRIERGNATIIEAARIVARTGAEPQPVPGRILMPLLEKASLEEDVELQLRWSALLASAAMNPDGVLPSFVNILGELSPVEARLLHRVHQLCVERQILMTESNTSQLSYEWSQHKHANSLTEQLGDDAYGARRNRPPSVRHSDYELGTYVLDSSRSVLRRIVGYRGPRFRRLADLVRRSVRTDLLGQATGLNYV